MVFGSIFLSLFLHKLAQFALFFEVIIPGEIGKMRVHTCWEMRWSLRQGWQSGPPGKRTLWKPTLVGDKHDWTILVRPLASTTNGTENCLSSTFPYNSLAIVWAAQVHIVTTRTWRYMKLQRIQLCFGGSAGGTKLAVVFPQNDGTAIVPIFIANRQCLT